MEELINQFCLYCKSNIRGDITDNLNSFVKMRNNIEEITFIKENYFLIIKSTEEFLNAASHVQNHLI